MKKVISLLFVLMAILVVSCGPKSKKGEWTKADKDAFYKSLEEVDLSSFGDDKQAWLDCYFEKCQANFESFAATNSDEELCKKLGLECNDEVLPPVSVKGKWCDADKKAFDDAMAGANLDELGSKKETYINCYFEKVQANYASFAEADQDVAGCEKFATECAEQLK